MYSILIDCSRRSRVVEDTRYKQRFFIVIWGHPHGELPLFFPRPVCPWKTAQDWQHELAFIIRVVPPSPSSSTLSLSLKRPLRLLLLLLLQISRPRTPLGRVPLVCHSAQFCDKPGELKFRAQSRGASHVCKSDGFDESQFESFR